MTNVLNIVLFEPEIHYNAGNVGRTCVALEAKLWLVRPWDFGSMIGTCIGPDWTIGSISIGK